MALSDFANKVKTYCTGRDLFSGVSCIVTGLSGGPDSIALLYALCEMASETPDFPKLCAVHVNHGLRPSAADDEELSRAFCERHKIEFKACHFDVRAKAEELGRGIEETGRILRYEAFADFSSQYAKEHQLPPESVRIATAHHKGDLAETFLMNLFRGTGLDGLTVLSSDSIIRPLICVSKDEILRYLMQNDLDYAVDETNLLNDYTRNKWRNEIIPMIGEVSVKDPEEAVYDTYRLLLTDADYLTDAASGAYGQCVAQQGSYKFLKTKTVLSFHPAVSTRIIRLYWKDLFGVLTDFEMKHVRIVTDLMRKEGGTKYADMPFGRTAVCVEGLLGFFGEEGETGLACAMASYLGFPAARLKTSIRISMEELEDGPKTIELPDSGIYLEAKIVENSESIVYNCLSWICAEKELIICPCPLDGSFRKAGSEFLTDIKKLVSDMKVPRTAREHLLAVCSEGGIMWIPGVGHSEGFISSASHDIWNREKGHSDIGRLIMLSVLDKE